MRQLSGGGRRCAGAQVAARAGVAGAAGAGGVRWCGGQSRPARRSGGGGRRGRFSPVHPAAQALHRQRVDDRRGRNAAAGDGGARQLGPGRRSRTASLTSPADDPRRVLARYELRAKKSWGQNFLVARGVHQRIVAAVGASAKDVIVEIGAGLGTLTAALAGAEPRPRRVIAVERDPDMLTVLRGELGSAPNVEIRAADAVTLDLPAI